MLQQLRLGCRIALSEQGVNVGERVEGGFELIVALLEFLEPVSCCDQGLLLVVPFVDWEPEFLWSPFVAEIVVVDTNPVSAYCFGSLVAVLLLRGSQWYPGCLFARGFSRA